MEERLTPPGGGGGGGRFWASGGAAPGTGGGGRLCLLFSCGDIGGDDSEPSSPKLVAPLSTLARGEEGGREGDAIGIGGGARLTGLESTNELFCGFSESSSSDSEPVVGAAVAGGGGGGGRADSQLA